jgi:hypothetical protein
MMFDHGRDWKYPFSVPVNRTRPRSVKRGWNRLPIPRRLELEELTI